VAIQGLPILRLDGNACPNYHAFKDALGTYSLRTYGMIGSLFEDGIMPNYPEPRFPSATANEEKEPIIP
jgi:hypothetical protein